jgi:hypothetical protein
LVDQAGAPRAVLIDYGGFLGIGLRKIAVSMQAMTFRAGQPIK